MPRHSVAKAVALATNHAHHEPDEPLLTAPPKQTWKSSSSHLGFGLETLSEILKRCCPRRFCMRDPGSSDAAQKHPSSEKRKRRMSFKPSSTGEPDPFAQNEAPGAYNAKSSTQNGNLSSAEANGSMATELEHHVDGSHLDIVQMSSPMYFVEEHERKLQVDIIRLGNLEGKCKVEYFTEDGSAIAGSRYRAAQGKVCFRDGEHTKPVDLWVLNNDGWCTTLEFKIHLTNPEGCEIGPYLHSARVKVIDDDCFPSSAYEEEIEQGEEGIEKIPGWRLLLEYFKQNLKVEGVASRTFIILLLDQLHNMYKYLLLTMQVYLVDVLFNLKEAEEKSNDIWLKGGPENGRIYTARLIAGLYIVPMFVLHLWDVQKVYLDLGGISREFLQLNLFRKYLNYSEESRQKVPSSHMQIAIIRDCDEVAEGYTSTLQLLQIVGKLLIVTQFILQENPSAVTSVLLMPAFMLVFIYFRVNGVIALSELTALRTAEVVGIVNEAVTKYGVIADYHQRPQIVDLFERHTEALNEAKIPMERMEVNNNYASKWLGPVFTGVYIAMNAEEVLTKDGKLTVGVFLATITIFRELAENFEGAYEELIEIFAAVAPLRKLTNFLNAETDLKRWKTVNRQRRELTKVARLEAFSQGSELDPASNSPPTVTMPTGSKRCMSRAKSPTEKRNRAKSPTNKKFLKEQVEPKVAWRTDLIDLKVRGMHFRYSEGSPYILRNVNVHVAQGSLVAVVGEHGSGKATLLRLLGHSRFPTDGTIFVPTHLRIVHVPKEPLLLNMSAWSNLTFGRHQSAPKRVGLILRDMNMFSTLALIRDELRGMGREGELHYDEILKSDPRLKEGSNEEDQDEDEEEESESDATSSGSLSEHEGEEKEGVVPWQEKLSATERYKIHLARALVMNPEVLVLHKPVAFYDSQTAAQIMKIIKQHVQMRGCHVGAHGLSRRRPRTCIFTPSNAEQMLSADRVWLCHNGTVRDMSLQEALHEKHRQKLYFFEDDDAEAGSIWSRQSLSRQVSSESASMNG